MPQIPQINDTPHDLKLIHTRILHLAIKIQQGAKAKWGNLSTAPTSEGAFYRVHHYALILHQSILCLCENGWAQVGGTLLRSLMDCMVSLAIICEADSEFRAFQYLYSYIVRDMREPNPRIPMGTQEMAELAETLQKGLSGIPLNERERFQRWAQQGKIGNYWFSSYYKSPSQAITKLLPKVIDFYNILSSSSHGGFFGTYFFLDEPFGIDLGPIANPKNARFLVATSCRFSIEICQMRNKFQDLGFDLICDRLFRDFLILHEK